jgi:phosphate transport system substrate-binding protein
VRDDGGARSAIVALGAAMLVTACASFPRSDARDLRVSGSDTMLPLAERWAEAFMAANPGAAVHVEGGGSAAGIAALVAGRVDLATASRSFLPEEVRQLAARHGTVGLSARCARDGVSVYVNPANPVREISLPVLKSLFAGRVGSWRKLGGPEAPVRVLIRPPSSGTHRLFRDVVLHEEPYSSRAEALATTLEIVGAVREDPLAVGYGGMAFGIDLVHCTIDGEPPTPENVRSGAYPLSRYLYLHAVRPPRGLARSFVDFVLSHEGQRIVEDVGFVPLWDPAGSDSTRPPVARP